MGLLGPTRIRYLGPLHHWRATSHWLVQLSVPWSNAYFFFCHFEYEAENGNKRSPRKEAVPHVFANVLHFPLRISSAGLVKLTHLPFFCYKKSAPPGRPTTSAPNRWHKTYLSRQRACINCPQEIYKLHDCVQQDPTWIKARLLTNGIELELRLNHKYVHAN